jgi:RNA polymerase sigma factor (sigma-70 family)
MSVPPPKQASAISGLDDALRRLAHCRDSEAWSYVIECAGADIERICARIASDVHSARDSVQETLLQIRDHSANFKPRENDGDQHAAALRWILRVAANTAIKVEISRQRAWRRDRRAAALVTERHEQPSEPLERADDANAIRAALASLPKVQRTVIALHHLAGLEYAAIAAEMRCPAATARTHASRGLSRMRHVLERMGVALSIGVIAERISTLPIVESDVSLSSVELLNSPLTAAAGISGGGFLMSLKIATVLAAVISATSITLVVSEDHAPPKVDIDVRPVQKDAESTMIPHVIIRDDMLASQRRHIERALQETAKISFEAGSDVMAAIDSLGIGVQTLQWEGTRLSEPLHIEKGTKLEILDSIARSAYAQVIIFTDIAYVIPYVDPVGAYKAHAEAVILDRKQSRDQNYMKQIIGTLMAYGFENPDSPWPVVLPDGIEAPVKDPHAARLVTAASFEWLAKSMDISGELFISSFHPQIELPKARTLAEIKAKPNIDWAAGFAYDWALPVELASVRVVIATRGLMTDYESGLKGVLCGYADGSVEFHPEVQGQPNGTRTEGSDDRPITASVVVNLTGKGIPPDNIFSDLADVFSTDGNMGVPGKASAMRAWLK